MRAADSAASGLLSALREPIRASASALPAAGPGLERRRAERVELVDGAVERRRRRARRLGSAPQPSRNEARAAPQASSSREEAARGGGRLGATVGPVGERERCAADPREGGQPDPLGLLGGEVGLDGAFDLVAAEQQRDRAADVGRGGERRARLGILLGAAEQVDRVGELARDERGEPAREAPARPGEARRLAADGGGVADRGAAQDAEPVRAGHEGRLDPGRDREALAAAELGGGGAAEAASRPPRSRRSRARAGRRRGLHGRARAGARGRGGRARRGAGRSSRSPPSASSSPRPSRRATASRVLCAGVRAQRVGERAVVLEQRGRPCGSARAPPRRSAVST